LTYLPNGWRGSRKSADDTDSLGQSRVVAQRRWCCVTWRRRFLSTEARHGDRAAPRLCALPDAGETHPARALSISHTAL